MNGLTGKSVVVTGGASGMGQSAAVILASAGCMVTIADIDEELGRETTARINREATGSAQFVRADVSDEANVKRCIESAVAKFGKLDGAVNAAGVAFGGKPLHEVESADWDRCLSLNLRSHYLCMKYQLTAMLKNGGGSIVAISSAVALYGSPNQPEYSAAKAGINGLVRNVAKDYASHGIRVNSILPGGTWTPMVQRFMAEFDSHEGFTDRIPMRRFARPEEIADGIVWLISDNSSYVTGASINIDGGLAINWA